MSSPLAHAPEVKDHAPRVGTPHVVVGVPAQPGLHVAVHVVPVVLLAEQLYTALRGLGGLVALTAHTAATATENGGSGFGGANSGPQAFAAQQQVRWRHVPHT